MKKIIFYENLGNKLVIFRKDTLPRYTLPKINCIII